MSMFVVFAFLSRRADTENKQKQPIPLLISADRIILTVVIYNLMIFNTLENKMKLLLHNMLSSKFIKGVQTGFPLILRATKIEVNPNDNDMQYLYLFLIQKTFLVLDVNASEDERKQFVEQMMPRLDYQAFRTASLIVNQAPSAESSKELPPTELPKELPAEWDKDSKFLSSVYSLLVGVEIVEGELECPETHRVFPIKEGIPNMLVRAEEVEG